MEESRNFVLCLPSLIHDAKKDQDDDGEEALVSAAVRMTIKSTRRRRPSPRPFVGLENALREGKEGLDGEVGRRPLFRSIPHSLSLFLLENPPMSSNDLALLSFATHGGHASTTKGRRICFDGLFAIDSNFTMTNQILEIHKHEKFVKLQHT